MQAFLRIGTARLLENGKGWINMKRVVASLVAAIVIGVAAPAVATPPVGGCPPPFELLPKDSFGPGFQDFLNGVDKNGDDNICAQPLPDALPFPPINFVDNVVRP